jgi:ubiquitin-conjugating enzyme E2 Q
MDDYLGSRVGFVLSRVAKLAKHPDRWASTPDYDSDSDEAMPDADELASDSDDMMTDFFDDNDFITGDAASRQEGNSTEQECDDRAHGSLLADHRLWRFYDDVGLTKDEGFRVGYYGRFWMDGTVYLSISIRISKLGISEAAMQAWDLVPRRYFVLLMRFADGYKAIQNAIAEPENISFRVGTSETYKPSYEDVLHAFSTQTRKGKTSKRAKPELDDWKPTFISRPLDELFNKHFMLILRSRVKGMSWTGAEMYLHELQGAHGMDAVPEKYLEPEAPTSSYVEMITDDHFKKYVHAEPDQEDKDRSCAFPVVAMQFALRHFVRCTEFCLVCHRKLQYQLEAVKPYVCDNPLCLYQYMTFNFGPSLEHEILTQPYVVDLLVSFCYSTATEFALREFPSGLGLRVPVVGGEDSKPTMEVRLKTDTMELYFVDSQHGLSVGSWVAIRVAGSLCYYHHRVKDVSGHVVNLSPHGVTSTAVESEQRFTETFVQVDVRKYKMNFDDLPFYDRCQAIREQLSLLPSVKDMASFVAVGRELSSWSETVPPAALSILRWVIASNRSCIMQVEEKDKIHGLESYMQFRFAMGSPVRFLLSKLVPFSTP